MKKPHAKTLQKIAYAETLRSQNPGLTVRELNEAIYKKFGVTIDVSYLKNLPPPRPISKGLFPNRHLTPAPPTGLEALLRQLRLSMAANHVHQITINADVEDDRGGAA